EAHVGREDRRGRGGDAEPGPETDGGEGSGRRLDHQSSVVDGKAGLGPFHRGSERRYVRMSARSSSGRALWEYRGIPGVVPSRTRCTRSCASAPAFAFATVPPRAPTPWHSTHPSVTKSVAPRVTGSLPPTAGRAIRPNDSGGPTTICCVRV